jgi:alpha-D-xyloside xylohydrolase
VAAGSIVPLGNDIQNTSAPQSLKEIRVYPGRDSDFTLYDDDGVTYDYEKGQGRAVHLHWDDSRGQLAGKGLAQSLDALTKVMR